MTLDLPDILSTLKRHDVRYVVIGGVAAILQGSPLLTQDIDICYEHSPENSENLAAALIELEAKLRGVEAKTFRNRGSFTFTTRAGPLDCMGEPAGTKGYEDLIHSAVTMELEGYKVLVASVDDLIRMKKAAGRPKDLMMAEELGALREVIENKEEKRA